jgi:hypothetical protein
MRKFPAPVVREDKGAPAVTCKLLIFYGVTETENQQYLDHRTDPVSATSLTVGVCCFLLQEVGPLAIRGL